MQTYIIGFVVVLTLYIAYEIHKNRRRNGKRGIPILGYFFDSFTVIACELEECETSGASSKSGKKHGEHKKHSHHHHHHKHHHKCSKKNKNAKEKQLQPVALDLVEDKTQRSEKKSSKALKKKLNENDSMDVVKLDLIPAPVKKQQ
uniref:Uncharacterized protein n=1 Tax=Panagrolaimus sp. ES5 TaxID=591445 RepID=A0AC34FX19_9BILA